MTLLATELKEGTKILHAEAGRSKFMKYFFKGEVSLATYGRFLISLYQVYNALEKALDEHKENPHLAPLYFPDQLQRKSALIQDLEFFNGPEWRDMLEPITPAQQSYVSAIERCSSSATPELLLAHAYVRYLGDLSGGQVLAKRLQKFNDIPEDKGVAFYHFELIEDVDQFKEMYRKRLNQVEVSEELQALIVEEAKETFMRNIELFREFDSVLEGLPMTRREQIQHLKELEEEKAQLAAAAMANKHNEALSPTNLSSWTPSTLWNSLVNVVRLPTGRVDA